MKQDLRSISIKAKLATASEYFKLMEAQLQNARSLETFLLASKYDLSDEEARNEHPAMKQYLEADFSEEYMSFFRHSFLIAFHSLVESALGSLCAEIGKERGLDIKATDFKGGPLDQARLFLTKLVNIAAQDLENWPSLHDLAVIRNCLVHAEGTISRMKKTGEQERLWILVEKGNGLRLNARHASVAKFASDDKRPREARLIVEAAYCRQCLTGVEGFFNDLFGQVGWK